VNEKEISKFDWHDNATEEYCLLEGRVVMENKDGKNRIGAGRFYDLSRRTILCLELRGTGEEALPFQVSGAGSWNMGRFQHHGCGEKQERALGKHPGIWQGDVGVSGRQVDSLAKTPLMLRGLQDEGAVSLGSLV